MRQKAKMRLFDLTHGLIECPCGERFETKIFPETINMEKIGDTWHPICPHCHCMGSIWEQ